MHMRSSFAVIFCLLFCSAVGLRAQFSAPGSGGDSGRSADQERRARLSTMEAGPFARKPASFNTATLQPLEIPEDPTVLDQVGNFFKGLVGGIRIGGKNLGPSKNTITLDPPDFSVRDRREVESKFSILNRRKDVTELQFPNEQRIDLTVAKPDGEVIERWSEDRSFATQEGFVVINPNERIEYTEKLPTRDLQAGTTYTVRGEIKEYPEYEATTEVTPTNEAPRAAAPVVGPNSGDASITPAPVRRKPLRTPTF